MRIVTPESTVTVRGHPTPDGLVTLMTLFDATFPYSLIAKDVGDIKAIRGTKKKR